MTLSCKGAIPIYYRESESRCVRVYCCIPKGNLTLMSNLWKARLLSIFRYAATSPNSSFHSFKHFTVKLPQWSQVRTLQRIELLKKGGWWSSTKNFATIREKSKRKYPVRLKSMYHRPSLKFKYLKKKKHPGILFMIWTKTAYTRIYNAKYSNFKFCICL